jgi:hypothetical protein
MGNQQRNEQQQLAPEGGSAGAGADAAWQSATPARKGADGSAAAAGGVSALRFMSATDLHDLLSLGPTDHSLTQRMVDAITAPPPVQSSEIKRHLDRLATTLSSAAGACVGISHHDHLFRLTPEDAAQLQRQIKAEVRAAGRSKYIETEAEEVEAGESERDSDSDGDGESEAVSKSEGSGDEGGGDEGGGDENDSGEAYAVAAKNTEVVVVDGSPLPAPMRRTTAMGSKRKSMGLLFEYDTAEVESVDTSATPLPVARFRLPPAEIKAARASLAASLDELGSDANDLETLRVLRLGHRAGLVPGS